MLFRSDGAVIINCEVAAAFILMEVEADVRSVALVVMVNVPAVVSMYLNVAVELRSGIVTEVMSLFESLNTPLPLDDERSTVVAPDMAGLPYSSFLWTVKSPLAVPAVAEDGFDVIISCDGGAEYTS